MQYQDADAIWFKFIYLRICACRFFIICAGFRVGGINDECSKIRTMRQHNERLWNHEMWKFSQCIGLGSSGIQHVHSFSHSLRKFSECVWVESHWIFHQRVGRRSYGKFNLSAHPRTFWKHSIFIWDDTDGVKFLNP